MNSMHSTNGSQFESVIGLEVHSQLLTKTKMFCTCPNIFGIEPNSAVCPVCLGLPGALPVINFEGIKLAVKAALALNIVINKRSVFVRKNYFYPDLPKGYQISQYLEPVSSGGYLDIKVEGVEKRVEINRLHIEEDAGKLIHIGNESYVDLNRAGTPLVEIVSEPNINSSGEAVAYLKELRDILVYLGVSDGNMEEGSFRCDANVSVRKKGDPDLGTRTEVKNVNSFKFVEKAINYEIERQIDVILNGGKVIQETRLYDSRENLTRPMRGKEEAHDYRYFEEPDLPPLILTDRFISEIKGSITELPAAKRERYAAEYLLAEYDSGVLTQDKEIALYFEDLIEINEGRVEIKKIANWVINDLLSELKTKDKMREKRKEERVVDLVKSENFLGLILEVEAGNINKNTGKTVLTEMLLSGKKAGEIIKEKNLAQVSDEKGIGDIIEHVLEENPKELAGLISGKDKLFGFFVGAVMKKTKGKANPKKVNEILKRSIAEKNKEC
ncbi:Asp-tRNA(Asn)/Glu-tRNA(Gln) amidotransferase subunit GatB [Candidatus Acidulodesulfobacterium sp. H_13]|uniref:Asp-tRNA(Asn)/Glu-tRNA(Gln) amidotransferase subunit GatB n=1 Tax=Candidatus Acidulodesulfobacterium sp. H_13 TaxID=3395470 RepID=UPI003AF90585